MNDDILVHKFIDAIDVNTHDIVDIFASNDYNVIYNYVDFLYGRVKRNYATENNITVYGNLNVVLVTKEEFLGILNCEIDLVIPENTLVIPPHVDTKKLLGFNYVYASGIGLSTLKEIKKEFKER